MLTLYTMDRDQTIAHIGELEKQWADQPDQRPAIEPELRRARDWLKDLEFCS